MTNSISLCMIVKNEEKYLRGCLESARSYVDEIVVVDTGSTDSTIPIAKEFGAKVFSVAWTGSFSEARNESLQHATGDWVLYLDADERLVDGEQLKSVVNGSLAWAYTLLIRGKHHLSSGIVDQVNAYPRLFRRHHKVRFEGVVHEQIMPSIIRLGKSIEASSIIIEHLGYGDSYEKILEKGSRNIALLKVQHEKHPDDDYTNYQLGNNYVVLKDYDAAEPILSSVSTSVTVDNSIRSSALNLLVEIAISKEMVDAAKQYCIASLELTPVQTMAKWFLSGIIAHQGKYQDALTLIDEIRLNLHQGTMLSHDIVLSDDQIQERELLCYEMLSGEAQQQSNMTEAYHWITEAENKKIFSILLQRRGLDIALSRRDIPSAYSKLEYLVNHLPAESADQRAKFKNLQLKLQQFAILP